MCFDGFHFLTVSISTTDPNPPAGHLAASAFRTLCAEQLDLTFSEGELAAVMAHLDNDGSGSIEFNEVRRGPCAPGRRRASRGGGPRVCVQV